jgi:putative heme-binding domain-containing protein
MTRAPLLAIVCLLTAPAAAQAPAGPKPIASPTAADLERGHALYDAQCARCHGIGGTGGMGPPLARPKLRRAPDDQGLVSLLAEGVPGTPMAGAWQLSERETAQVAAYVRSLGRLPAESLPGDPARGRAIYEGKGACAACHIVAGSGSGLGPELSEIGDRRGSAWLRESLLDPGAVLPERAVPYEPNAYAGYLVVRAVKDGGAEIVGARLNEDSFTIQLRDAAGKLHSLRKAELRTLEKKEGASLMPSYRGTLTPAEIDDLVAYLMTLRARP